MEIIEYSPLQEKVEEELRLYFKLLEGQPPCDLHSMVITQVEETLFRVVLEHCRGNQSKAASFLGINRGTLRKKLNQYGLS